MRMMTPRDRYEAALDAVPVGSHLDEMRGGVRYRTFRDNVRGWHFAIVEPDGSLTPTDIIPACSAADWEISPADSGPQIRVQTLTTP